MLTEIAKAMNWLVDMWIAHHELVFVVGIIWIGAVLINR